MNNICLNTTDHILNGIGAKLSILFFKNNVTFLVRLISLNSSKQNYSQFANQIFVHYGRRCFDYYTLFILLLFCRTRGQGQGKGCEALPLVQIYS